MEILPESTSNSSAVGSDDGVTTLLQLSQNSRPHMLDHQDRPMMKAQVHVSKSTAISDEQPLPLRKHYCQIYQVVKHVLRGRLLASFQNREHEGGDTRSRMKGSPKCMRIFGFMHGVNNPELTKRLNEHVPKTMKEMMITTTAFIRREAAVASKKKDHVSWKPEDQSKRHTSDKRSGQYSYCRTVLTELEDLMTALQPHSSGVEIQEPRARSSR
uniref:Reverse transcriptase domain-containing protein n=1 Tax=Tanacetum cinerariifolium TaxID=118510 RepID=A0A699I989_TANCI|nr:reverse transcriptase domain-containing protein [Tanacetum cinerariifolium]